MEFISPYASNDILSDEERVKVIDYFNRLDEEQAINGFSEVWVHYANYKSIQFRLLSLNGLRILSRLLRVKVHKPEISFHDGHCCAVATATKGGNTLAGAYAVNQEVDSTQKIAGTLAIRNAIRAVIPQYVRTAFIEKRKVFFAHPLSTFHSKASEEAVSLIKKRAPDWIVLNPEEVVISSGEQAIRDSIACLRNCHALVFIGNDNHLPKGVYGEIAFALNGNMPVFLLNSGKFVRVSSLNFFKLDKLDWNAYARIAEKKREASYV